MRDCVNREKVNEKNKKQFLSSNGTVVTVGRNDRVVRCLYREKQSLALNDFEI